ncbi:hypothetical protein SOVF_127000 [Spinacia oleracea]|uniref:PPIase cyclophilin-type domain-containing protein n=1 Tax=Spinacia oleracea TaxID=3562 RepID=A0A9R0I2C4_SPIOL|nr:uncharacterized protein LOC110781769 [Spinacia oleracea]KNA12330.1 hypothetical protein SOVF_127000 [Spinacia oleracea]
MGRRPIDSNMGRWTSMSLLMLGFLACTFAYLVISIVLKPRNSITDYDGLAMDEGDGVSLERENRGGCCRGIPNLELWGTAVKWGTKHKFDSEEECCKSCKAMCSGKDGPCLCDTWVFCGDRSACGPQFGECWLKKQNDSLVPQRQDVGSRVMWTSGLIFGKGEGIIGLETEHGTLHIKLYPDSAPYSVQYILELLTLRHCAGCQFYRAEGRGDSWDIKGSHIKDASFGPPFALIQGTLEAAGTSFQTIPTEVCRTVRRGAVAWVGSGPEFFISLANHVEWKNSYTVFGSVLPEDMEIAEKIAQLPTKPDIWNNINVSVLETPIPILIQRIKTNHA